MIVFLTKYYTLWLFELTFCVCLLTNQYISGFRFRRKWLRLVTLPNNNLHSSFMQMQARYYNREQVIGSPLSLSIILGKLEQVSSSRQLKTIFITANKNARQHAPHSSQSIKLIHKLINKCKESACKAPERSTRPIAPCTSACIACCHARFSTEAARSCWRCRNMAGRI